MIGYNVAVLAVGLSRARSASWTRCPEVFVLIHRRRTTLQQVSSVWSCEWITALCVCLPPLLPQNPGIPPVDIVRDPRIGRLWTKYKETDLPVPKFKVSTLAWRSMPHFSLRIRGAVKSCRHTPLSLISGMRSENVPVGDQNNTLCSDACLLLRTRPSASTRSLKLLLAVVISAVRNDPPHTRCNINSCHSSSRSMSVTSAPCLQRRWLSPGSTTISGKDFLPTCAKNSEKSRRSRSCTIRRTKSTWG